jgi:hypothetical protein
MRGSYAFPATPIGCSSGGGSCPLAHRAGSPDGSASSCCAALARTFRTCRSDAAALAEAPIGTIWSLSPWTTSVGIRILRRSSVKSVSEICLMHSYAPRMPPALATAGPPPRVADAQPASQAAHGLFMIDRRVAGSGPMRRDALAMPRASRGPRKGRRDELQWRAIPAAGRVRRPPARAKRCPRT